MLILKGEFGNLIFDNVVFYDIVWAKDPYESMWYVVFEVDQQQVYRKEFSTEREVIIFGCKLKEALTRSFEHLGRPGVFIVHIAELESEAYEALEAAR